MRGNNKHTPIPKNVPLVVVYCTINTVSLQIQHVFSSSQHVYTVFLAGAGDSDEANPGSWLRSCGQPHILQTKHLHAAGRRQEDLRQLTGQDQRGLLLSSWHSCTFTTRLQNYEEKYLFEEWSLLILFIIKLLYKWNKSLPNLSRLLLRAALTPAL